MNTKQFLVLALSFSLTANVVAMDKKRQQEEQKEAARRRIAEQRAERAAAKASATTPAAKTPAPQIPVAVKQPVAKALAIPANVNNNNNDTSNAVAVKEPAKKAALPAVVPAKPVAPVVEPKGKEELNEEPSVWLRDKATYLADYRAAIAGYCDSVTTPSENEIATGIRQSLIDAERAMQAMNQAREWARIKLQTIEDAYANDQDFAQLRTQFQALVTIYNTQEQLLEDVHNEDLWELMNTTLAGLISEQSQHATFVKTLTKLKKCFTLAHALVIESAQDIFSEEDANLAAIRQLEELDREEAARASAEAMRIFEQEEATRREQEANGLAVAQLLDEENHQAATGNDALLAQEAADRFAREQEEEDLARALSLQEDNRPAANDDARLAREMAARFAAEQAELDRNTALAFGEANRQPAVDNDALIAQRLAQELDEQERASLELARRMQNEWNG